MKSRRKNKTQRTGRQRRLTPLQEREVLRFLEFHSTKRLSDNLRTMLLEFLMYDGTSEAVYLKDLANDLEGLFRLLEAIGTDTNT